MTVVKMLRPQKYFEREYEWGVYEVVRDDAESAGPYARYSYFLTVCSLRHQSASWCGFADALSLLYSSSSMAKKNLKTMTQMTSSPPR